MSKLVLLRHGQSIWNLENRFTGWVDVSLSEKGILEAMQAGKKLASIKFNCLFTSVLKRATETAEIVLDVMGQTDLQKFSDKALNERSYGDLQGLNKDDTREKYGADKVHIWRRSYDVKPPNGESLKDTCIRVLPFYHDKIVPCLKKGNNVLVVAHGNSLRGLLKEIDALDEREIVKVEIPTGEAIVYEMDENAKVIEKGVL